LNGRVKISLRQKLVIMFLLVVALATATVVIFAYRAAYRQFEANFSRNIMDTAVTAAINIDGDKHSKIKSKADMQTREYQEIRAYCEEIKKQLGVPYAYTLVTRNDKVYFIIATESPPGKEYSWQSGMKEAFAGQPSSTEGFYTDQYGTFKTAYAPIRNNAGQVVGVMAIDFNAGEILAMRAKILRSVAISAVIVALVCAGLAVWFARRIADPMKELEQSCREMAGGDFTRTINIRSNDEIGQLAQSLNDMKINLKALITNVKQQAESVATHSQELASASEEVSATVEEVASTTNEVAVASAQEAENAEEAARESEQMRQVAIDGSRAVRDTIAKINAIASSSQNVSVAVQRLGEQSSQIGEIINTITNIADQTNLLALNAAIEAARAGEHGRGFAVVAEEVRKLAEQSAGAASEITDLIKEIQIGVGEAIAAMKHGTAEVNEGVQVAGNAGDAIERISQAVENNTSVIQNVAAGARQANEGTQQLTEAGEQIASTIEQVSGAAQQLANIATALQKTVEKFKVDSDSAV